MYQLHFREELDEPVAREFEHLVASLRAFLLEEHSEEGRHTIDDQSVNFVPVGGLMPFAGPTAPQGWLICDGSQVDRVRYGALFKAIGTTHGAGNGVTSFNLPDMRERFAVGAGGGLALGETGGQFDHVHEISSDGLHDHGGSTDVDGDHVHLIDLFDTITSASGSVDVQSGTGTSAAPGGHEHNVFGDTMDGEGEHGHGIPEDGTHDHGGATLDANPPYTAFHWIIFAGV